MLVRGEDYRNRKPLRPGEVQFVNDLPKTSKAKVIRRIITAAFLGDDPSDPRGLVYCMP